jgi:hypothetical protein
MARFARRFSMPAFPRSAVEAAYENLVAAGDAGDWRATASSITRGR